MITINDKWRIRTDPYNYIPERWFEQETIQSGVHKGKVREAGYKSIERYYGTLKQALVGILHYEIANEAKEEHDVKSFLEALDYIVAEFPDKVESK